MLPCSSQLILLSYPYYKHSLCVAGGAGGGGGRITAISFTHYLVNEVTGQVLFAVVLFSLLTTTPPPNYGHGWNHCCH